MWGVSAPVWAALNVPENKWKTRFEDILQLVFIYFFSLSLSGLFQGHGAEHRNTVQNLSEFYCISTGSLYFLNTAHPAATSRPFPHFSFHVIIHRPAPSQAVHSEARVHVTFWWAEQRLSSNNSIFVALNRQLRWFTPSAAVYFWFPVRYR